MGADETATAWHREHVYFSRLLDLLQAEVERLHAREPLSFRLMLDIVEYLRVYCGRYHHAREDALFALMAGRHAFLQAQVERLKGEHRALARSGDELLRELNEVAEGRVSGVEDLQSAAASYLSSYRRHIAAEEDELVNFAARTLSAQEWQAVADAAPVGFDPVFGVRPHERYRELLRRFTP
jgi:hemerythrin-like domain-containing protein